jgi:galactokinase
MLAEAALRALCERFAREVGCAPRVFRAPGRINVIGEHTDYNDGFVLPLAIDRETLVLAAPRADRRVRATSLALQETRVFDLDALHDGSRSGAWIDHVRGTARSLAANGAMLRGAELWIAGDLPIGAGLASSAALEIATGFALCAASGLEVPPRMLAQAAIDAEHVDVGTRCGPMDPLVVALAQEGHALLLDCRSLAVEHVAFDLPDAELIVCDTAVKHALAGSAYNERRLQCEAAARAIAAHVPGVRALRDVGEHDFARVARDLPEPLRARAHHVVTENARVSNACDALRAGDCSRLGTLMTASHASLRDDFAVSCAELDLLVDTAVQRPGVLGARMTGGGFGGCAIVLVLRAARQSVQQALGSAFERAFGRPLASFVARASAGASESALR